ncbi:AAA family ATPase [Pedobacter sp. BG31]|uniref:AAA family ATPase n=1 Tax=Pedobacter sp. BG31 TaxID=3349697 RepID=UPI0035F4B2F6
MAKKIYNYKNLKELVIRLRDDLKTCDFILLYAHNGTGKTRVSMEFKEQGKKNKLKQADTLYFNAFTEDLFSWDNDIVNDRERVLKINSSSKFFSGFQELELENRIRPFLNRYADFDFSIDYDKWQISFSREVRVKTNVKGEVREKTETVNSIKVSRGEENMFIWCVFLAICQLAIDGAEAYNWVKYFYIDDPISSLDDNNAIAVASDLSQLLLQAEGKIKVVVSSHHILFYNVVCNEIKKKPHEKYFLYKKADQSYSLRKTTDTPYFHHVALLSELKEATVSGNIKTFHFNILRSILEKTSSFFGFNDFGKCIYNVEDEVLFERALNLLSHGKHSIYEPVDMNDDNKELFKRILDAFLDKHQFELPELLKDSTIQKL